MNRRGFFGAVAGLVLSAACPVLPGLTTVQTVPRVLTMTEIEDLVRAALADLGRLRWTDISSDLQKSIDRNRWANLMAAKKVKLCP